MTIGFYFINLNQAAELSSQAKLSSFLKPNSKHLRFDKYFSVKNSSHVAPVKNNNFVLSFWVKFKNLPSSKFRDILLTKIKNKKGYAVAIKALDGKLYPQVYWSDGSQEINWFTFNHVKFKKDRWYQFYLSFSNQETLGLKLIKKSKSGLSLVNLGGYSIKPTNINNIENIILGSKNNHFADFRIANPVVYNLPEENSDLSGFYSKIEMTGFPLVLNDHKPNQLLLK